MSSLALFAVMLGLLALPIISFNSFKGPNADNSKVLGTSIKSTSVIDGRVKYTESRAKIISFEIILEPKEYFTKTLKGASGTSQIVLTEGNKESYATNKDGEIEIINLSDSAVWVKGMVF